MSREALVLLVCCCDFRDGAERLIPSKSLRNAVIWAFPGLLCILRMCAPRRAAAVVWPRGREKSADRRRRILISRLLIIRTSVPRRKSPFPAYFRGFPAVSPLIPPYPAFLKYPVSPHCPKPGGEDGLYDAALEAKKQGKIRHISITNHRLAVAHEAIDSGLYETLQFPFSYLAGEQEMGLVRKCRETNMGFIAMKGMAGGLIRDGFTAAAWMAQQDGVVPIWGVQRESELDQFLQCIREGVELTDERKATIERDRKELCGEFCRGCGYCMPCPAGIEINQCARMSLMLRRAPAAAWLTEEWQQKMHQIENCRHCGHCMSKCPYGLNTPELLQANYKDYWEVLAASKAEK